MPPRCDIVLAVEGKFASKMSGIQAGTRNSTGLISFGPFQLDTDNLKLSRDGLEIELRPQALYALRVLALNSSRCVPYEEMIGEAWHGTSVSRHTVAVTVGEVRRALKEFGEWIHYHPKLGYCLDVPQSDDLIRNGWHFWHRHTREGFEKALECFNQAAETNSADFRAYEGISRCYLMLGTFAMRQPVEMYARFLEAHQRAVELGGMTAELRADRAQGLHIFELRFDEAESELLLAAQESPRSAGIHVRLAILYTTMKRFEKALESLQTAYAVDNLQPILPTAEILVRCALGEFEKAVACGKKALDLHPYLALGRSHYAQALEFAGRRAEALVQYRIACVMTPDLFRLRAEEAQCLALDGQIAEAKKIAKQLETLRKTEYVDGYYMAFLYDALGKREEALENLERAERDGSPLLFMLDVDPRIDGLRNEPDFHQLRDRVFRWRKDLKNAPAANQPIAQYKPKAPIQPHRVAS